MTDDLGYGMEKLEAETLKPKQKWFHLKRIIILLVLAALAYLFFRYIFWRI